MKGTWYIYRIINNLNGKDYIGKRKHQDSDSPLEERYMGSGKLIKEAIVKYSRENFKKEILDDEIKTDYEAAIKEIIWIAYFKNKGGANYNLNYGGDSKRIQAIIESPSFKNFNYLRLFEEAKEIINKENLASFYNEKTEEWKINCSERISKSLKEYNKNLTPKEKEILSKKLSEAQKEYNKRESKEHKQRRSRNQSIGQGKVYKIIDPQGNVFEIKALALWCRETFKEKGRSACATLQIRGKYMGYKLIRTEERDNCNSSKTYRIRTPNGEEIIVHNLAQWSRETFNKGSISIRGPQGYKGYQIIEIMN